MVESTLLMALAWIMPGGAGSHGVASTLCTGDRAAVDPLGGRVCGVPSAPGLVLALLLLLGFCLYAQPVASVSWFPLPEEGLVGMVRGQAHLRPTWLHIQALPLPARDLGQIM